MYYHVFIADTCNLLIGSVVLLNPPHAFDPPTHVRPGRAEALATLLELETLEQLSSKTFHVITTLLQKTPDNKPLVESPSRRNR